ncbi:MAG: hypothetical protein ACRDZ2_15015 [Ilumatobacteraceae bacterium]
MPNEGVVVLDHRRRAALSKFVRSDGDTYIVHVDDDGTITLTPGSFIANHERRLHANRPDLVESITAAVAQGRDRKLIRRSRKPQS